MSPIDKRMCVQPVLHQMEDRVSLVHLTYKLLFPHILYIILMNNWMFWTKILTYCTFLNLTEYWISFTRKYSSFFIKCTHPIIVYDICNMNMPTNIEF